MSFKGKKNVYLCPTCGHGFISMDIDEGVTPFMTTCQSGSCNMSAMSLGYKIPQQILERHKPVIVWYKPDAKEFSQLNPFTMDHVNRGGLISRPWREGDPK